MTNPFSHYFEKPNRDDTFLIQDPFGVRHSIQTIISVPEHDPSHITGIGTCFRVSPWGFLTAHHNFMHAGDRDFPQGEVGCVGFSPGYVMGAPVIQLNNHFGAIRKLLTPKLTPIGGQNIPHAVEDQIPDIVVDIAALRVDMTELKPPPEMRLLKLASQQPKLGDQVLGIGYPTLGSKQSFNNGHLVFEERMHGAVGTITDLYPNGRGRSKPWSTFQVEGNWRSGMSGGPVLNTVGEVVGIISSSFPPNGEEPGIGFAVNLSSYNIRFLLPELLPESPNCFRSIGHFRDEKLIRYGLPEQFEPETFGGSESFHLIDVKMNSSDYIIVKENFFNS